MIKKKEKPKAWFYRLNIPPNFMMKATLHSGGFRELCVAFGELVKLGWASLRARLKAVEEQLLIKHHPWRCRPSLTSNGLALDFGVVVLCEQHVSSVCKSLGLILLWVQTAVSQLPTTETKHLVRPLT